MLVRRKFISIKQGCTHTKGQVVFCIFSFSVLNKTIKKNDVEDQKEYSSYGDTGYNNEGNFGSFFKNGIYHLLPCSGWWRACKIKKN